MSIAALRKITLYGVRENKDAVLEALQEFGRLHLIPLSPPPAAAADEPSPRARLALRYLLSYQPRRHQVHDRGRFDPVLVEERALALRALQKDLRDERDTLERHLRSLEPWGDFTFPPLPELQGLRLWFYVLPHYQLPRMDRVPYPWQEVQRDARFSYVVVICRHEPLDIPAVRAHTGGLSLAEIRRRLEEIEVALEELESERASLSRWCDLLADSMHRLEDRAARQRASATTLDDEHVFIIQGWLPHSELTALRRLATDLDLAVVDEAPGKDDAPPTLLRPQPVLDGGRDLVRFYMVPGYGGWDPSLLVAASFALFFAMILSDAGYGMVLGLILAGGWKRLGASPPRRRLRGLLVALVALSIVYGVLVGSYFGIAPHGWLQALVVMDARDASAMMTFSLWLGVIHICIANLRQAVHQWPLAPARAALGWVLAVAGGAWLWSSGIHADQHWWQLPGAWLLVTGLALVWRYSATGGSRFGHWLGGTLALTRAINAFSDVLSYLRLFALGLASTALAAAFNDLAAQVQQGLAGFGTLLALLLIIVGHGLNFTLAVVAGVVHGLRLNFIEFFNWGVHEEGRPFQPFAKKENQAWSQ